MPLPMLSRRVLILLSQILPPIFGCFTLSTMAKILKELLAFIQRNRLIKWGKITTAFGCLLTSMTYHLLRLLPSAFKSPLLSLSLPPSPLGFQMALLFGCGSDSSQVPLLPLSSPTPPTSSFRSSLQGTTISLNISLTPIFLLPPSLLALLLQSVAGISWLTS